MTIKGNVFNTDYIGKSKKDIFIIAKVQKEKRNSLSHSQKRIKTNLTKKTSSKKSKNLKCLACDIRGHTFFNCWYLFKGKRPKGFVYI